MNRADPLDNLGSGDAASAEIPPAPEDYESEYPLVSERSKRDLQEFGLNMVDDYRDFKHELLSWLATYGKNPEKHEGLARSTLESTHYKLETAFRWPNLGIRNGCRVPTNKFDAVRGKTTTPDGGGDR